MMSLMDCSVSVILDNRMLIFLLLDLSSWYFASGIWNQILIYYSFLMLWRQVAPDHRESLMAPVSSQTVVKPAPLCCGKRVLFLAVLVVGIVGICILGLYRNVLLWHSVRPRVHTLHIGYQREEHTLVQHTSLHTTNATSPQLLLTIFTTFKDDPERSNIHYNVLRNWAEFRPHIKAILFSTNTNPHLTSLATKLGWLVVDSPRTSKHGVPYLREMYTAAQNLSHSVFYGYSNGDLLFDQGLCDTMAAVYRHLPELHRTMVIGQRTNFLIGSRTLFKASEVKWIAKNKGDLFRLDAEDYFFIAHNSFPWSSMPDLVIGRPAYDNYMVGHAIQQKISVIDATQTLTALHQTGRDGNFAGHKNSDAGVNSRAIGRFNYGSGLTTSAQYMTRYQDSSVTVWARPRRGQEGLRQLTTVRPVIIPTLPTSYKPPNTPHTASSPSSTPTSNTKVIPHQSKPNNHPGGDQETTKVKGSSVKVSQADIAHDFVHSSTPGSAPPTPPLQPNTGIASGGTTESILTLPWKSEVSLIMEYLQEIKGNTEDGWLTHWGRDKMAAISQTSFSNAFSWMKSFEFQILFDWNMLLWVRLTISHHWFR